jgi:hypothetical protein
MFIEKQRHRICVFGYLAPQGVIGQICALHEETPSRAKPRQTNYPDLWLKTA